MCPNEQLVENEKWYAEKYVLRRPANQFEYSFRAVLHRYDTEPNALSVLNAKTGECNDLNTRPGSKNCGLGSTLMYLCFIDPDITRNGGLNPRSNTFFRRNPRRLNQAKANCKTLAYVVNTANPPIAAVGYFNAAYKAGYKMIFTYNFRNQIMKVLKVKNAKQYYIDHGKPSFTNVYGNHWFFCNCKALRIWWCKRMT